MTTDQQDILNALRTATTALSDAMDILSKDSNKENRADVTLHADLNVRVLQQMITRISVGAVNVREYWEEQEKMLDRI